MESPIFTVKETSQKNLGCERGESARLTGPKRRGAGQRWFTGEGGNNEEKRGTIFTFQPTWVAD